MNTGAADPVTVPLEHANALAGVGVPEPSGLVIGASCEELALQGDAPDLAQQGHGRSDEQLGRRGEARERGAEKDEFKESLVTSIHTQDQEPRHE